ncbi:hypothetical protein Tco_0121664 [Tanacetum coccineum]
MCPREREHIKQEIESKITTVTVSDDEYAIRRLDSKTQYAVLIRRFDTSYPTGGYGVSGDQSEQNTI